MHDALAVAVERLASLAAASVRASFAFINLTGNDRRSFGAGLGLPAEVSHDAGVFWRSGIGNASTRRRSTCATDFQRT